MLAVGFGRSRQAEHFALGPRDPDTLDDFDGGDRRLTLRQGAGLVEEHGIDRAHRLEREPVLDEDAGTGGALGGDRHDQRNGQTQGVRTGDDEHGDRAHDRRVRHADERPDDRCDHGSAESEPEQPGRGSIGDALGSR